MYMKNTAVSRHGKKTGEIGQNTRTRRLFSLLIVFMLLSGMISDTFAVEINSEASFLTHETIDDQLSADNEALVELDETVEVLSSEVKTNNQLKMLEEGEPSETGNMEEGDMSPDIPEDLGEETDRNRENNSDGNEQSQGQRDSNQVSTDEVERSEALSSLEEIFDDNQQSEQDKDQETEDQNDAESHTGETKSEAGEAETNKNQPEEQIIDSSDIIQERGNNTEINPEISAFAPGYLRLMTGEKIYQTAALSGSFDELITETVVWASSELPDGYEVQYATQSGISIGYVKTKVTLFDENQTRTWEEKVKKEEEAVYSGLFWLFPVEVKKSEQEQPEELFAEMISITALDKIDSASNEIKSEIFSETIRSGQQSKLADAVFSETEENSRENDEIEIIQIEMASAETDEKPDEPRLEFSSTSPIIGNSVTVTIETDEISIERGITYSIQVYDPNNNRIASFYIDHPEETVFTIEEETFAEPGDYRISASARDPEKSQSSDTVNYTLTVTGNRLAAPIVHVDNDCPYIGEHITFTIESEGVTEYSYRYRDEGASYYYNSNPTSIDETASVYNSRKGVCYYEFRVLKENTWSAYCEPVRVEWLSEGKLDTPTIMLPDEILAGKDFYVSISPVRNATRYSAYLYTYDKETERIDEHINSYYSDKDDLKFKISSSDLTNEGTYQLRVYAAASSKYESSDYGYYLFETTGKVVNPLTVSPTEAECYIGGTITFHLSAENATRFRYKEKRYSDWNTKYINDVKNGEADADIRFVDTTSEKTYEYVFSAYINNEWTGWTEPVKINVKERTDLNPPEFHFESNQIYKDEEIIILFDDPEYKECRFKYSRIDENGVEESSTNEITPEYIQDGKCVFDFNSFYDYEGGLLISVSAAKNGDDWTPYSDKQRIDIISRGELREPIVSCPAAINVNEDLVITVQDVDENADGIDSYYENGYGADVSNKSDEGIYTIVFDKRYLPDSGTITVVIRSYAKGYTNKETRYEVEIIGNASEWEYEEIDGGLAIKGYKGSDIDIVIPDEIDGKPVTAIADAAFARSDMNSISLPDTIKSIGNSAFRYCNFLTKIKFNQGLKSIGSYAISSVSLAELELPNTLESIGYDAFETKVANLVIPESVQEIGRILVNASTEKLVLPASLDQESIEILSIESSPSTALQTISIPDGVKSVEVHDLKGLTKLELPDSATDLKLSNLPAMTSLTLSENITTISNLSGLVSLSDLQINTALTNVGPTSFNGTTAIQDYSFISQLSSIGRSAFNGSSGMTEVTFGSGITQIISGAFANCTNLRKAVIPGTVTSIYDDGPDGNRIPAFYNDPLLEIWGERDSAAENYAKKYNIPFHEIGTNYEDPVIQQVPDTYTCESEPLHLYFRKIKGATDYTCEVAGAVSLTPDLQNGEDGFIYITITAEELEAGQIQVSVTAYFDEGKTTTGNYVLEILPEFSTEEFEDGALRVTAYNGSKTDVTVPERIDGKAVADIAEDFPLFRSKDGSAANSHYRIEKLTLPASLTGTEGTELPSFLQSNALQSVQLLIPAGGAVQYYYLTSIASYFGTDRLQISVYGDYQDNWENAPDCVVLNRKSFWTEADQGAYKSIKAIYETVIDGNTRTVEYEHNIALKDQDLQLYLCVINQETEVRSVLSPITVKIRLPELPRIVWPQGENVLVTESQELTWEDTSEAGEIGVIVRREDDTSLFERYDVKAELECCQLPDLDALGEYTVELIQDHGTDYQQSVTATFTALAPPAPQFTEPKTLEIYPATELTISWENPAELPTKIRITRADVETPEVDITVTDENRYIWDGALETGEYEIEAIQSEGKEWEQWDSMELTLITPPPITLFNPEEGQIKVDTPVTITWENPGNIKDVTLCISAADREDAVAEQAMGTETTYQWNGTDQPGEYRIAVIQGENKSWEQTADVSITVFVPDPPKLLWPQGETVYVTERQTIKWENQSDATSYYLLVTHADGTIFAEAESVRAEAEEYQLPELDALGVYTVNLIQDYGKAYAQTVTGSFTVISPPAPVIISPENGEEIFPESAITIRWNDPGRVGSAIVRITRDGEANPTAENSVSNRTSYEWKGPQKLGEYTIEIIQNAGKTWEQRADVRISSVMPDALEIADLPSNAEVGDTPTIRWKGGAKNVPVHLTIIGPYGTAFMDQNVTSGQVTLKTLNTEGDYTIHLTQFEGKPYEISATGSFSVEKKESNYTGTPYLQLVSDPGEEGFWVGDLLEFSAEIGSGKGKYVLYADGSPLTYYDGTRVIGVATEEGTSLTLDTTMLLEGGYHTFTAVMADDADNVSNNVNVTLQTNGPLKTPGITGAKLQSTMDQDEYLHFTIYTVDNAASYIVQLRSVLDPSIFAQHEFSAPAPTQKEDGTLEMPTSFEIDFGKWNRAGRYNVRVWAQANHYDLSEGSALLEITVVDYALHVVEIKDPQGNTITLEIPDDLYEDLDHIDENYDRYYGVSFLIMDESYVGDETTGKTKEKPYVFPVDSYKKFKVWEDPIDLPTGGSRKVYLVLVDMDHLENGEVIKDIKDFTKKEANLANTFSEMGNFVMYYYATVGDLVVSRSRNWYMKVEGPRLRINHTPMEEEPVEAWTCEELTFTVEDPEAVDGDTVELIASWEENGKTVSTKFAEGTMSAGSAEFTYGFKKSGLKHATAKVASRTSVEHLAQIKSLGKLDPPALACDPVQFYEDGIYMKWPPVNHADGYTLRVRDENGEFLVQDMKADSLPTDENGSYYLTVPKERLKGIKAYELYMLDYGYQYDQNECDPLTVKLVDQDHIGFTMDKDEVQTKEEVTFTVTAHGTLVQLMVDGKGYETWPLNKNKAIIKRAFTISGEKMITFRVQHADGTWGEPASEKKLIVNAKGDLDAVVIRAPEHVVAGNDWQITWDKVKNAEEYVLRIMPDDNRTKILIERSSRDYASIEVMGKIQADEIPEEGKYLIYVMATATGYNQSDGYANTVVGPETGIYFSMTPHEIYVGDSVHFEVTAYQTSKVQLFVDDTGYDTLDVTGNKATLDRKITLSGDKGERKVTFKSIDSGEFAEEQILKVKSYGQLDKSTIKTPDSVLPGKDWEISWGEVSHADTYKLIINNLDSGACLWEKEYDDTKHDEEIPGTLTDQEMNLQVIVRVTGVGYDQNENTAAVRIGLPEIVISITPDDLKGPEKKQLDVTITVKPASMGLFVNDAVIPDYSDRADDDMRVFTYHAAGQKEGTYSYTVMAVGQDYMAGRNKETQFTITFTDTNKPVITEIKSNPGTVWAGTDGFSLEIDANQFTETVRVEEKIAGAWSSLAVLENYDHLQANIDAGIDANHFTLSNIMCETTGDRIFRAVPINEDDQEGEPSELTVKILKPGQLSKPEIVTPKDHTILMDEINQITWKPLKQTDMPPGVQFAGYFLQVYSTDGGVTETLISDQNIDPNVTAYELKGMTAGKTYHIELFARDGNKNPQYQDGNCDVCTVSYRTIPDFMLTGIETDGYVGGKVKVKWGTPSWEGKEYHPDKYVIWWYGPGIPVNEAGIRAKAYELDGNTTSAELPAEFTFAAGGYSVEVYAIMNGNPGTQKLAGGNGVYTLKLSKIDLSSDVEETGVTVTATVSGRVDLVAASLTTLSGEKVADEYTYMRQMVKNGVALFTFPASLFANGEEYWLTATGRLQINENSVVTDPITGVGCEVAMKDGEITSVEIAGSTLSKRGSYAFAENQKFVVYAKRELKGIKLILNNGKEREIEGTWNEEAKTYSFNFVLPEGINTVKVTTLDGSSGVQGILACPSRVKQEYNVFATDGCEHYNWPTEESNHTSVLQGTEMVVRGTLSDKWVYVASAENKKDKFFVERQFIRFVSMNGWRYTLDLDNDTIQIYNDELKDPEAIYYLKISDGKDIWSLTERQYRISYFISEPHFRREYSIAGALRLNNDIEYMIHIMDARTGNESGVIQLKIENEMKYYITYILVKEWKTNGVEIEWIAHPQATNYHMELSATGVNEYKKKVAWTMEKEVLAEPSTMMKCILSPQEIVNAINNRSLEDVTWFVKVSLEAIQEH